MEMAMAQSLERGERLLLLLSAEEQVAVEDFRRRHQLSSRSEAIHAILRKTRHFREGASPRVPAACSRHADDETDDCSLASRQAALAE
jgi:hypothetical protein